MLNNMAVLFIDVDGTIIDSYPGIRRAFLATLEQLGEEIPDENWLRTIPGPPLEHTFSRLNIDPLPAKQIYNGFYSDYGWKEAELFPGWPKALAEWKAAGHILVTATSKGEFNATRMLDRLGVLPHFDFIGAANQSGTRVAKSDVIAHVIDSMQLELDPSDTLMIGDRHHDIEGAAVFGIPTALVTWGYGTQAEWQQAQWTAADMAELKGIVNER